MAGRRWRDWNLVCWPGGPLELKRLQGLGVMMAMSWGWIPALRSTERPPGTSSQGFGGWMTRVMEALPWSSEVVVHTQQRLGFNGFIPSLCG